jgi:hypothetical protein
MDPAIMAANNLPPAIVFFYDISAIKVCFCVTKLSLRSVEGGYIERDHRDGGRIPVISPTAN